MSTILLKRKLQLIFYHHSLKNPGEASLSKDKYQAFAHKAGC